jgi:hypothetical protein
MPASARISIRLRRIILQPRRTSEPITLGVIRPPEPTLPNGRVRKIKDLLEITISRGDV